LKTHISFGPLELEIDTLGARITRFSNAGEEVMKLASDELQGFNGMVLAPWPNRIANGKYQIGQDAYQLEINEFNRNNALHGFAYKTEFDIKSHAASDIVLEAKLTEPKGYPFEIHLQIIYKLDESGFRCEFLATNNSDQHAPFGIGFHPYFPVDDRTKISIPANTHILTDKQMIPVSEEANPNKEFLFGDVDFDDCFTQLERNNSIAEIQIESNDRAITLWQDPAFNYVMVYTTSEFEALDGPSKAIAIEPQTCPANAFNTEVPMLKQRERLQGSWGISFN
jgi:aldose 1-epimerase